MTDRYCEIVANSSLIVEVFSLLSFAAFLVRRQYHILKSSIEMSPLFKKANVTSG